MPILLCKRCWAAYGSAGELPPVCPSCGRETTWTTAPVADPIVPYELKHNDRRFLKSIRVKTEETP